jgi:hypothetical protein
MLLLLLLLLLLLRLLQRLESTAATRVAQHARRCCVPSLCWGFPVQPRRSRPLYL